MNQGWFSEITSSVKNQKKFQCNASKLVSACRYWKI